MQQVVTLKLFTKALYHDLLSGRITLWAGSMVYTTLLSLVPVMAISFSLLKAFGVHNQLFPVLLELLTPLGEQGVEIGNNLLAFVDRVQVGVLSVVGITFLFVTVVLMIAKIEDALNEQWQVAESRPWHRRISYYLSTLMLAPLLLFSAITFLGSLFQSELLQSWLTPNLIGSVIELFYLVLPILITIAAFTLIYQFLPHTPVKLGAAFKGALVATLTWKLAGWLFSLLISKASSYDAIYSSFTILIVLIIWLYLTWLIFILGGRIAFYIQQPHALHDTDGKSAIPDHALLALNLMSLIADAFKKGSKPPNRSELCIQLQQNNSIITPMLDRLKEQKLIHQHDSGRYTPARALDSISLYEIIDTNKPPYQAQQPLTECTALTELRKAEQQERKKQFDVISLAEWMK